MTPGRAGILFLLFGFQKLGQDPPHDDARHQKGNHEQDQYSHVERRPAGPGDLFAFIAGHLQQMPGIDQVHDRDELQDDMRCTCTSSVFGHQGRQAADQADGIADRDDVQESADQEDGGADLPGSGVSRICSEHRDGNRYCCSEKREHGDVLFNHGKSVSGRQRLLLFHIFYVKNDADD